MKMQKIIAIILLSLFSFGMSAQKKNVDAAAKLIGKIDNVAEARNLLKDAMNHDQTKNDSRTYYTAGMVEWRSYDNDIRKRQINPKDGSVNNNDMSDKILNGYDYFKRAILLDTLPDKKGRVKPRYTKEILGLYDQYAYDIYRASVVKYSNKKYYPEAYNGFMTAAALGADKGMPNAMRLIPDTLRRDIYYYAAISAYAAKQDSCALDAFARSLALGLDDMDSFSYIMAIWENRLRGDYADKEGATDSLYNTAMEGYRRYGVKNPTFIKRSVEIDLYRNNARHALEILSKQIELTPDTTFLYGERAWVEESLGMDDDALMDYRKAAEMPGVTSYTLMRAAHKFFRMAAERKKNITGTGKQAKALRRAIITDFLDPAMEYATRAKEISTDPKEKQIIDNLIENIDFDLSVLK